MENKPLKHLYVVARNHMDPAWLRGFIDHIENPDGTITRPYSELEEQQILEYMDFAELYGVKYHLEQAGVVKLFLEKNPDQKERFTKLVQEGLIELAGGGEYVIDRNLSCGESWVRNHLYAIDYYKKTFNKIPRYAITPDIFGLPAQLPQFFRSIGYDADIIFDRVMLDNKPFWRGLDGTKIMLDNQYLGGPYPRTADCVKLQPCNVCRGEGCPVCNGTGIDPTYDTTRPDKRLEHESYWGNRSADEFLATLEKEDKTVYYTQITCEETRIGNYLYKQLLEAAPNHNFVIHFVTYEENHDRWCPGQVDALRRGDTPEELTDVRVEGNPMLTGTYTSRIEVKKANFELENAMMAAERLCTLALEKGGWNPESKPRRDYPAAKIASLWNKLSYVQFHDNLPGSIVDGAWVELQRIIRQIRGGVAQIYRDAAREYIKACRIDAPEGYEAVVVFNVNRFVNHFPQIVLQGPDDMKGIEVKDESGKVISTFDLTITPERVGTGATVVARADVPALGHKVLFWKPIFEASEADDVNARTCIENEYYRVTVAGNKVTGVWDKVSGRQLLGENALHISLIDDNGSEYTLGSPANYRVMPFDEITFAANKQYQRLIGKGHVSEPDNRIADFSYTVTLTLRAGEKLLRVGTDINWDGSSHRIRLTVPAAFETDKKVWGEVAFGMLARPQADPDDVVTNGYAGMHGEGVNVALLKRGLPGINMHGDCMEITIARACGDNGRYSTENVRGRHVTELALTSWEGEFADADLGSMAASFALPTHTEPYFADWVSADAQALPESGTTEQFAILKELPANICLSALKPAEDGNGFIIRVWESMGRKAVIDLPAGMVWQHCNSLEQPDGAAIERTYTFRPFEIATFRMK